MCLHTLKGVWHIALLSFSFYSLTTSKVLSRMQAYYSNRGSE
jgi:hypothetical protein